MTAIIATAPCSAHETGAGGFHVLHAFGSGTDGASPNAGLIMDRAGNLFGTTTSGGAYGYGTVFEVTPNRDETVLYSFTGGSDGASPNAGLLADKSGNLFGTAATGGSLNGGVVFEVAQDGTETVLHAFTGEPDGATPLGALISDKRGNMYGTTRLGGNGYGTVYRISATGTETVLDSFVFGPYPAYPRSHLILDKSGNLFGMSPQGGSEGYGTIFEIAADGTETVLLSFTDGNNGGSDCRHGLILGVKPRFAILHKSKPQ
ncbi:MAG TPA: choice-of-anchor tandem repeat GloVer-containing protein [Bryobacteraceae bacterium]